MVKITQAKTDPIKTVDDDCIIKMSELLAFWKKQSWDKFPLLTHQVYTWSKKNKCLYLRVQHLNVGKVAFQKALLFKNAEKAKQFRAKWIEPLLRISAGSYSFSDHEFTFDAIEELKNNKTVKRWLRKNKIKIKTYDYWVLFDSPKDLLLFKMRWM